jgi:hypothetical protein
VLGKKVSQASFSDVDHWWEGIPKNSFWHKIRVWSESALKDRDFAHWYATTGRYSLPPSFVITLMVIQLHEGWSDREAVEAAYFDDRVKYALRLSRTPEVSCERSTFCKYRGRFLEADLDRALLRNSLEGAAADGLLLNECDIVDSFMVAGAATRQGTLSLIRSAIQLVLKQAKQENLPIPELCRNDYGNKKRPAINWNDADARAALLQELVDDADTCYVFYGGEEPNGSEGFKQRLGLLRLVATQDVTRAEDGKVTITQGTAPDRVISTVDPEMRHGRKTTSAKFDGYKDHVSTQNVDPAKLPRLVTAVVVTGGNVADGDVASALMQERKELTGETPNEMMGDTSYGSPNVAEKVSEVAPDIRVIAPVPPTNNSNGRFPKTDFTIDTENKTITCPAGQTVSYEPKRPRKNHKTDQTVTMDAGVCAACPMREQCVKGNGARTIRVRADEAQIQERRAEQETDEWQLHYCERSRVEHVNAELTRHGGRKARYWGIRKILFQERFCAFAHNLKEIVRINGIKWPQDVCVRPQSA